MESWALPVVAKPICRGSNPRRNAADAAYVLVLVANACKQWFLFSGTARNSTVIPKQTAGSGHVSSEVCDVLEKAGRVNLMSCPTISPQATMQHSDAAQRFSAERKRKRKAERHL